MAYEAKKRLKVGHDTETDTPIYREYGDLVPEVETWGWQIRESYIRGGYIERVAVETAPAEVTT